MKLIIPVFPGSISASIVGMMDMLNMTKVYCQNQMKLGSDMPFFSVELVSLTNEKTVNNCGFTIECHDVFDINTEADIIVVPAAIGNMQSLLAEYQTFVQWMKAKQQAGTVLCSTCTGAFFVAATGVLDHKEATTSWFAANEFRNLFPFVKLQDEKIIVDNGKQITGGATMSFQNLVVYLIEKFYGKTIGNQAAKLYLVEKGKYSQSQFSIFNSQKNHSDNEILTIQAWIENNITEKIVISELANRVSLAERTFIRRFKAATGNTPSEYIQRAKVEFAKQLLEDEKESIKEISYKTGYEDITYFRGIFKKYTGLTPIEYKKQFTFNIS